MTLAEIEASIKAWVPPTRYESLKPFLLAEAQNHKTLRDFCEALIQESEVGSATGEWLELAASNYGVFKTQNETDEQLRTRTLSRGEGLTAAHILDHVNTLLANAGLSEATLTQWFEGDHFCDDEMYCGFGTVPMPNGFIVDVPRATDADTCTALGALIDSKRAAGVSFAITQRPPANLPATPAWITVDPMLSPGTYDATNYLTAFPDLSGNGRTMTLFNNPKSSKEYTTRNGVVRLPMSNNNATCAYLGPSTIGITSFAILDWCRHDASLTNSREMGATLITEFGTPTFKSRYLTTVGDQGILELASSGNGPAVSGSPAVPFRRDGSVNEWFIQARIRRVVGNTSTWTWIIIEDKDDTNGPQITHQSVHSESVSMTLTGPGEFQTGMENTVGVELNQGSTVEKEQGGTSVYLGTVPSDEEIYLGLVWAAGRFSEQAELDVAALLGV